MKYVAVKHKPSHTKVWWFIIPDDLKDKITLGTEVICETKRGDAYGKVVQIIDGVSQEDAEKIIGEHFPLKSVIAVNVNPNIEEIHIPLEFAMSNPSAGKISKRVNEFYRGGRFDTKVIFSPDYNLRDGYTAYLVAKMFDHISLKGFCYSNQARGR